VSVAYQTSGSIAVSDGDALRFAGFGADFAELAGAGQQGAQQAREAYERVRGALAAKGPGGPDTPGGRRARLLAAGCWLDGGWGSAAALSIGLPHAMAACLR
jgi:hypothetical protein